MTASSKWFLLLFKFLFTNIIKTLSTLFSTKTKAYNKKNTPTVEPTNRDCFCFDKAHIKEISIVMEKLGLQFPFEINGDHNFGSKEIWAMFEKGPSLEEVKEAFDVFDEDKDGFIDAQELRRVVSILGVQEDHLEMEACTRMISGFDENGDGLIDFSEFVKLMEQC